MAMNPADTRDPTPPTGAARPTRWQQLIGVLGIAVVVWAGSNIYDVVASTGPQGSGGHQPPGTSPDDGGTPSDQSPPPAGDQHDPSQFDHG